MINLPVRPIAIILRDLNSDLIMKFKNVVAVCAFAGSLLDRLSKFILLAFLNATTKCSLLVMNSIVSSFISFRLNKLYPVKIYSPKPVSYTHLTLPTICSV
eukprot:TRINITY_DN14361_c0_g1_i1.p2 TRINITY_DN14361_c0_g1~~TRINITY_DN14361_c0_g1_i1.p2  ORF type:complete len:101 (-),score=3.00 TRINITY_DN14361_c0_g1_i1:41-343(-)